MLEAMIVVPALAFAYLVAAPTTFWRRIRDLAVAGAALVMAAGWWVAVVALTPAADRPFVGGSTNNSVLQLAFGYNGLSRITGNRQGRRGPAGPRSPAGPAGAAGQAGRVARTLPAGVRGFAGFAFGGRRGVTRLFGGAWATDAAWLVPAALITLVAGLWLTRRRPRTDPWRAGLLLFGGWMLVSALVFSYAGGIVHEYYTVALVPAVGALAAIGAVTFWRRRSSWVGKTGLSAMVAATGVWSFVLLDRTPSWNPWLRYLLAAATLAGVAAILAGFPTRRRLALAAGALAVAASLLGPAAYSAQSLASGRGGALMAGPAVARGRLPEALARDAAELAERNGFAFAIGREGGGGGDRGGGGFAAFFGGRGGTLPANNPVVARLEADASRYRWVAATTSAPQAAPYELAAGEPLMAIGGFMGSDNAISLPAFQQLVRDKRVHYFIDAGLGPGGGRGGGLFRGAADSDTAQIASWVTQHFTPETVGGTTLYDLTATPRPGA
jgi:4-amino-4-deoxy-L-arabinose transferase-like glycosyltransferase